MLTRPLRIISWFSCGAASAVMTKKLLEQYGNSHDIVVARCVVAEEHGDGERFAAECAEWFGRPVLSLRSEQYSSCKAVWEHRKYMSGVKGAPCTDEMKREVRRSFEKEWKPDIQAFGFTAEEGNRANRFREQNPEVGLVTPLITAGLSKEDCHTVIEGAGIAQHAMYRLGFPNANCIGCVKSDSPSYWNHVRKHFPEIFEERATQSRSIGCKLIKTTKTPRIRMFLDELPPDMGKELRIPNTGDCGILCGTEDASNTLPPGALTVHVGQHTTSRSA